MNNTISKPRRGRPSKKPVDENRIPLPGDIIISRFIKPRNITQKEVAEGLGIPLVCFSAMLGGRIRISAEYALRLPCTSVCLCNFGLGSKATTTKKLFLRNKLKK